MDEAVHVTDECRVQNLIRRIWMDEKVNSSVEPGCFLKWRIRRLGEWKHFAESVPHAAGCSIGAAGWPDHLFTFVHNLPVVVRNDHKSMRIISLQPTFKLPG